MMRNCIFLFKTVIAIIVIASMSGCFSRTAPTHFYVLNPMSSLSGDTSVVATVDRDAIIGVGPAVFPEYLDRPQIVTRTSSNELHFAEFDRWGGSLQGDFLRVLAENLTLLLATDKVVVHPWVRATLIEYQVILHVSRFDGTPGPAGEVVLKARWAILGDYGRQLYSVNKTNLTESVQGGNYSDLVKAKSLLVAALSKEIAQELYTMIEQNSR